MQKYEGSQGMRGGLGRGHRPRGRSCCQEEDEGLVLPCGAREAAQPSSLMRRWRARAKIEHQDSKRPRVQKQLGGAARSIGQRDVRQSNKQQGLKIDAMRMEVGGIDAAVCRGDPRRGLATPLQLSEQRGGAGGLCAGEVPRELNDSARWGELVQLCR